MENPSESSHESTEASGKAEAQHTKTAETDINAENKDHLQKNDLTLNTSHHPDENNLDNLDDDLDDLDDMLDEFAPVKPQRNVLTGPENHTPPPLPQIQENEGQTDLDNEFEKQLEAELAQLFSNPEASSEIAQGFETVMKELLGTVDPGKTVPTSEAPPSQSSKHKAKAGPTTAPAIDESFQDTIKKTMERMAASGDQATAAASDDPEENILAEMLKAMQSSNLDGEGGGEEDFSKVLLGMMEQLTNKEILYDPMKELNDKFPSWMQTNSGKVSLSDLKRYKEQQLCVGEIVQRFESSSYSDECVADKEYIVERMQKMQAAGSPPADLVGDMAATQEVFGSLEESCPTQ
ncbi:hypothetical protein K3495_g9707 [Podosphaera aphanis]|nr:hypothetical protein K3495_g9707 [Podosphaera aphanis]